MIDVHGLLHERPLFMKYVESELASSTGDEAWVIDVHGLLHERPLFMKYVESELMISRCSGNLRLT